MILKNYKKKIKKKKQTVRYKKKIKHLYKARFIISKKKL